MFRSSLEINLNDVIPKPTYDTVKPKEFLTKNPFVHKLEWNDTYDKIKVCLLFILSALAFPHSIQLQYKNITSKYY